MKGRLHDLKEQMPKWRNLPTSEDVKNTLESARHTVDALQQGAPPERVIYRLRSCKGFVND